MNNLPNHSMDYNADGHLYHSRSYVLTHVGVLSYSPSTFQRHLRELLSYDLRLIALVA